MSKHTFYVGQNCGDCVQRTYGDVRLISPCLLKITADRPGDKGKPHPRARDFGAKCKRFEPRQPTAVERDRGVEIVP